MLQVPLPLQLFKHNLTLHAVPVHPDKHSHFPVALLQAEFPEHETVKHKSVVYEQSLPVYGELQ